jgi:hypothetical protein
MVVGSIFGHGFIGQSVVIVTGVVTGVVLGRGFDSFEFLVSGEGDVVLDRGFDSYEF